MTDLVDSRDCLPLVMTEAERAAVAISQLEIVRNVKDSLISKLPPAGSILSNPARYFLGRPGKLYRPLLTTLTYELLGGSTASILEAACSIELIHCSALILDDLPCMDDAMVRRDQLCVHKEFGEAVAILTAIYFFNKAYQCAAKLGSQCAGFLSILSECVGENGMVAGQAMDIQGGFSFEIVAGLKTGSLMKAAVAAGAYLGYATPEQKASLLSYAEAIGIAFQLRDDIIDGHLGPERLQGAQHLAMRAANGLLQAFPRNTPALALAAMAVQPIERDV